MQLDSSSADGQLEGLDYWDLADDLRVRTQDIFLFRNIDQSKGTFPTFATRDAQSMIHLVKTCQLFLRAERGSSV